MMTWEQFYDGYLCWFDSTISSRLSQIYDLQNADTAEIVDCCQCIDETLTCRLLRKAEKAQLSFTYAQVAELAVFIGDEELLNTLAIAATGLCAQEDLEELNNNEIRDDVITDITKHYNLPIRMKVPSGSQVFFRNRSTTSRKVPDSWRTN